MQGWDSVELKADVEIGGNDQLFNLMVGRELQKQQGQKPQICLTTPIIEGLDGVQKMSKSLDNYIGIEEPPGEIYGKLLSIGDDLMWRYYELCTDVSPDGIAQMRSLVERGELHPKKAKEGLATRIVADFQGERAAREAREEFERVFSAQGVPDVVPEFRMALHDGKIDLLTLLTTAKLATSRTEAQRLLRQGAVRIDDQKPAAGSREIEAQAGGQRLIKVGRRRFARVTFE
jgi:tyrosyl-tRNA synthetase